MVCDDKKNNASESGAILDDVRLEELEKMENRRVELERYRKMWHDAVENCIGL